MPGGGHGSKCVTEGGELARGDLLLPTVDGSRRCVLGCTGASVTVGSEHEQAGTSVAGVRGSGEVSAVDQMLDQFAGGLFGDTQVVRELGGRCRGGAQSGEGEAVHRADVVEAGLGNPLLDAFDNLGGETQHSCGGVPAIDRHEPILTYTTGSLTM